MVVDGFDTVVTQSIALLRYSPRVMVDLDKRGDLWRGGDGVFKFNGKSFDRIH